MFKTLAQLPGEKEERLGVAFLQDIGFLCKALILSD